jgi:hypothetical protein
MAMQARTFYMVAMAPMTCAAGMMPTNSTAIHRTTFYKAGAAVT